MSEQSEKFGEWLCEALQSRGYNMENRRSGSQQQFAADLGTNPSQVSRVLTGQRLPSTEMFVAIARVLGLPLAVVLGAAGIQVAEESGPVTVASALDAWGISNRGDRALVEALVERLRRA